MPALDIIVCTLDRHDPLLDVVHDLRDQTLTDWRLWIVDQSAPTSADATRERLDALRDDRIHHVVLPVRGLPNARNEGLARASSEVVLFLDDDVRLGTPDLLQRHVDAYADSAIGGASGRILDAHLRPNRPDAGCDLGPGGRVRCNLTRPEPTTLGLLKGAQMSFRRSVFHTIGGFDRRYTGTAFLEDGDVAARVRRAGWTLRYLPDAVLTHLGAPTGGCRPADALDAARWRFHHTGYFVTRHRDEVAWARTFATFGVIAAREAVRMRAPFAVPVLLDALMAGRQLARSTTPDTDLPAAAP